MLTNIWQAELLFLMISSALPKASLPFAVRCSPREGQSFPTQAQVPIWTRRMRSARGTRLQGGQSDDSATCQRAGLAHSE